MAPFPAAKAFSNGENRIQNSSDNTRILKSKSMFNFFSNNHWRFNENPKSFIDGRGNTLKKKNGSVLNGPVFINCNGCLSSVGGFNVNNYDFLRSILIGRKNSELNCLSGPNKLDKKDDFRYKLYPNYNINNKYCINERDLSDYFLDGAEKYLCEEAEITRDIWFANYTNISLQQGCIFPSQSYNMGLNTCSIDENKEKQTFIGTTFKVNKNSNIWYDYTGQDINLNYITWPIPTVESNNPGLFYTATALSDCPKCNGGELPYRNNTDNVCILNKYSSVNLNLLCNYNFGRLMADRKRFSASKKFAINMSPKGCLNGSKNNYVNSIGIDPIINNYTNLNCCPKPPPDNNDDLFSCSNITKPINIVVSYFDLNSMKNELTLKASDFLFLSKKIKDFDKNFKPSDMKFFNLIEESKPQNEICFLSGPLSSSDSNFCIFEIKVQEKDISNKFFPINFDNLSQTFNLSFYCKNNNK